MRLSWAAASAVLMAMPAVAGTLTLNDIGTTLALIEQRASATIASPGFNTSLYPYANGQTGAWSTSDASKWTSGFWPWELTSLYRATGNAVWLNDAIAWTTPLAGQAASTVDADTGMRMLSYGALYSITGDPAYKAVLAQAAATLSGRFNATIGAINQWDFTGPGTFTLLADGMNDLEPLAWIGANGGDPALLAEAESNANLVASTLVRADGSTYQQAQYNPTTGVQTFLGTYQGYSNTSDWQRGLTWEMNGFTELYKQTGDPTYLQVAETLANHFISVLPSDCVSYWDASDPAVPNALRDTSAAALGALALTELGVLAASPGDQNTYQTSAQCVLKGLINGYLAPSGVAVLTQGNAPGIADGALIYGDGAFTAALAAQLDLAQGQNIDWTVSYGYDPVTFAQTVPEPGSLAMMLTTVAGLWLFGRGRACRAVSSCLPLAAGPKVQKRTGRRDFRAFNAT